jgi:hypothetical protein
MAEFARIYLGGKSSKTGKRTVLGERIPYFVVNGKMYVKESDAERWRESKVITPEMGSLKDRVVAITARIRARKETR